MAGRLGVADEGRLNYCRSWPSGPAMTHHGLFETLGLHPRRHQMTVAMFLTVLPVASAVEWVWDIRRVHPGQPSRRVHQKLVHRVLEG